MSIEKVAEPNRAYIYVDPDDTGDDAGAANWFNVDDYKDVDTIVVREGYFSVKDKIGDIMKNEEAGNVLMQFMQATVKMKLKKSMLGMVKDMTLEGMAGMASSMGIGRQGRRGPRAGQAHAHHAQRDAEQDQKVSACRTRAEPPCRDAPARRLCGVCARRRESAEKQICPLSCARGRILYVNK